MEVTPLPEEQPRQEQDERAELFSTKTRPIKKATPAQDTSRSERSQLLQKEAKDRPEKNERPAPAPRKTPQPSNTSTATSQHTRNLDPEKSAVPAMTMKRSLRPKVQPGKSDEGSEPRPTATKLHTQDEDSSNDAEEEAVDKPFDDPQSSSEEDALNKKHRPAVSASRESISIDLDGDALRFADSSSSTGNALPLHG